MASKLFGRTEFRCSSITPNGPGQKSKETVVYLKNIGK
jgi:hypothetical protein